jgi:hypothetical protein
LPPGPQPFEIVYQSKRDNGRAAYRENHELIPVTRQGVQLIEMLRLMGVNPSPARDNKMAGGRCGKAQYEQRDCDPQATKQRDFASKNLPVSAFIHGAYFPRKAYDERG